MTGIKALSGTAARGGEPLASVRQIVQCGINYLVGRKRGQDEALGARMWFRREIDEGEQRSGAHPEVTPG